MTDAFPLEFLQATCAGWPNRKQAQIIGYQAEVIRVLKEQLGDKRPRLTDDQRRRLAAKGKPLADAYSAKSQRSSRQTRF